MFGMEGPNGLQLRKERDNIAMKRKIDRKMKDVIDIKTATKGMTEGNCMKLLVQFFLPILAGNFFQQFYNFVDSVIVGKGIGDAHWRLWGIPAPCISLSLDL